MCYTCFLNRASFKTLFHMWCPFLGVVYGGTALCYRVLFIVWCDFQCPAIFATVLGVCSECWSHEAPKDKQNKSCLRYNTTRSTKQTSSEKSYLHILMGQGGVSWNNQNVPFHSRDFSGLWKLYGDSMHFDMPAVFKTIKTWRKICLKRLIKSWKPLRLKYPVLNKCSLESNCLALHTQWVKETVVILSTSPSSQPPQWDDLLRILTLLGHKNLLPLAR